MLRNREEEAKINRDGLLNILWKPSNVRLVSQHIQFIPALTDFKGPTIFICYRRISVITNIEIKEKLFKKLKESFCYRRIFITDGSARAGFNNYQKHFDLKTPQNSSLFWPSQHSFIPILILLLLFVCFLQKESKYEMKRDQKRWHLASLLPKLLVQFGHIKYCF